MPVCAQAQNAIIEYSIGRVGTAKVKHKDIVCYFN